MLINLEGDISKDMLAELHKEAILQAFRAKGAHEAYRGACRNYWEQQLCKKLQIDYFAEYKPAECVVSYLGGEELARIEGFRFDRESKPCFLARHKTRSGRWSKSIAELSVGMLPFIKSVAKDVADTAS